MSATALATRAVAAALIAAALGCSPDTALAQEAARDAFSGIRRTIDRIEPRVGSAGDAVTVSSGDMPSITAIRIGLGVANVGFEELADLVTSMDGDFSVEVTVPEWAEPDRVHRFIVFDLYFRPIALSGPFHVTDTEGLVRRTGRVAAERGGCLRFVDLDDVEYALERTDTTLPPPGEEATLIGRVRAGSLCDAPFTLLPTAGPGVRTR